MKGGEMKRLQTTAQKTSLIGKPIDRVDGPLKVSGRAKYSADFKPDGDMAYGALVMSTIASGRIQNIDAAAAQRVPGVVKVVTHLNAPRLPFAERREIVDPKKGQVLHVLQTDEIYFSGQPIGVVVAETLEQAQYAADLVKVSYEEKNPVTSVEVELAHAFESPETGGYRYSPRNGSQGGPRRRGC
jgi:xanthine dehydrogenase YagR molybdenum-binding subunit